MWRGRPRLISSKLGRSPPLSSFSPAVRPRALRPPYVTADLDGAQLNLPGIGLPAFRFLDICSDTISTSRARDSFGARRAMAGCIRFSASTNLLRVCVPPRTSCGGSERFPDVFFTTGTDSRAVRRGSRRSANGVSALPASSADGAWCVPFRLRRISVRRIAAAVEDINLLPDVFLLEIVRLQVTRITLTGPAGGVPSGAPALDGSGPVVTFTSRIRPTARRKKIATISICLSSALKGSTMFRVVPRFRGVVPQGSAGSGSAGSGSARPRREPRGGEQQNPSDRPGITQCTPPEPVNPVPAGVCVRAWRAATSAHGAARSAPTAPSCAARCRWRSRDWLTSADTAWRSSRSTVTSRLHDYERSTPSAAGDVVPPPRPPAISSASRTGWACRPSGSSPVESAVARQRHAADPVDPAPAFPAAKSTCRERRDAHELANGTPARVAMAGSPRPLRPSLAGRR